MEHAAFICPFCGAPHREAIPVGAVQVKCRYCGGTILVPASFGGAVQRCPNHPDVFAVGLCNDCGGSFCDGCLSLYRVESGTLHLCPNCYKTRERDKATIVLVFGILGVLAGFVFIGSALGTLQGFVVGMFFILFLALPLISWGFYRTTHLPRAVTIKEKNEAIQMERESRKTFGANASASELYGRLVDDMLHYYEPKIAYDILERRISQYTLAGMSRQEAVIELAKEEGYI